MNDVKLLEKINALMQLRDEEEATCRAYKTCNACPNLLSGGYCEIRLAMSKLKSEIDAIYDKEKSNSEKGKKLRR